MKVNNIKQEETLSEAVSASPTSESPIAEYHALENKQLSYRLDGFNFM